MERPERKPPRPRRAGRPPEDDDISYEPLDDLFADEASDLEPIDIEALDDEIEPAADDAEIAEPLLESIAALDDEIAPEPEPAPEAVPLTLDLPLPPAEPPAPAEPEAAVPEPAPDTLKPVDIEALDDEIEPVELGDRAEELIDSLAVLDDEIAPGAESAPAEDAAPAAPEQAAPSSGETIYRVLIPLPDDLKAQVEALRRLGEIGGAPPPGVEFGVPFRTDDLPAVEQALWRWTRARLPLQLEIAGVQADVVGAQDYVAAWVLQPHKDLIEAQKALLKALAPLVTPTVETDVPPPVRVLIGDQIAAKPYPHVIAQMQRDFEPFVWHAETMMLVRLDPGAAPPVWEVAGSFE